MIDLFHVVQPEAHASDHPSVLVRRLQDEGKVVPVALPDLTAEEHALVAAIIKFEVLRLRIAHNDDELLHVGRLRLAQTLRDHPERQDGTAWVHILHLVDLSRHLGLEYLKMDHLMKRRVIVRPQLHREANACDMIVTDDHAPLLPSRQGLIVGPEAVHDLVLGRTLGARIERDAQAIGRRVAILRYDLRAVGGLRPLIDRGTKFLLAMRIDDRIATLLGGFQRRIEVDR